MTVKEATMVTKRKVFPPAVSEFGDGEFVESAALGQMPLPDLD